MVHLAAKVSRLLAARGIAHALKAGLTLNIVCESPRLTGDIITRLEARRRFNDPSTDIQN